MFRTVYCRLIGSSLLRNVNISQHVMTNNMSNNSRPLIEKGLNQVILMGRCGNDAVKRGTDTHPVIVFSLATHTHYKAQGSDVFKQKTDWHRISVFRHRLQEKSLNYVKKGNRLLVQGRLSYGEITDTNGNTHQTTNIVADDIIFLSTSNRITEEVDEDIDESIEN
ncbi:single-stranded DNA-binding protein, mitochondrial-like [Oppia nitens]|uniref:single-stranded DNA-binding protein, mitochondrial-like n=1 Tax=Oppia nitens TaxID=1686743 RepID=UPI0023D98DA8|nr:single-stranded DNA-binding protein, mitochondrial-like [Oppia nitens]